MSADSKSTPRVVAAATTARRAAEAPSGRAARPDGPAAALRTVSERSKPATRTAGGGQNGCANAAARSATRPRSDVVAVTFAHAPRVLRRRVDPTPAAAATALMSNAGTVLSDLDAVRASMQPAVDNKQSEWSPLVAAQAIYDQPNAS